MGGCAQPSPATAHPRGPVAALPLPRASLRLRVDWPRLPPPNKALRKSPPPMRAWRPCPAGLPTSPQPLLRPRPRRQFPPLLWVAHPLKLPHVPPRKPLSAAGVVWARGGNPRGVSPPPLPAPLPRAANGAEMEWPQDACRRLRLRPQVPAGAMELEILPPHLEAGGPRPPTAWGRDRLGAVPRVVGEARSAVWVVERPPPDSVDPVWVVDSAVPLLPAVGVHQPLPPARPLRLAAEVVGWATAVVGAARVRPMPHPLPRAVKAG
jgi:hypothetical protein